MADINVTPMCDVMIVLLIIFMVTTPLLDEVPGLSLPRSRTADEVEKPEDSVVVIRADGRTEMDGEVFASSGELLIRLQARLEIAESGARIVRVKADRGLRYGLVQAVLQACRAAGAERIALVAAREPAL
jgi:biopolymer transport protein ExbD